MTGRATTPQAKIGATLLAKVSLPSRPARLIFVTGTDTGSGKTLLTAFLLAHLRDAGRHALAMKPFATGNREDIECLQQFQAGEISDDLANPFFFAEPISPLAAARKENRRVRLPEVLTAINTVRRLCDLLLIEGIGVVMVPLGEGYTVLSVIQKLRCSVLVAAKNKLGVINHSILTVKALKEIGTQDLKVVLMGSVEENGSPGSNLFLLQELVAPIEVVPFPFLGSHPLSSKARERNLKGLGTLLNRLGSEPR